MCRTSTHSVSVRHGQAISTSPVPLFTPTLLNVRAQHVHLFRCHTHYRLFSNRLCAKPLGLYGHGGD